MEVISPQGTTGENYLIGVVVIQIVLLSYDDSGLIACVATSLQTVVPFQTLAAFNGKTLKEIGFRIRDAYETDTGILNSASINICTGTLWLVNFELTNLFYIQIRIKLLFSLLVRLNLELK
jgi:hypothetical protein